MIQIGHVVVPSPVQDPLKATEEGPVPSPARRSKRTETAATSNSQAPPLVLTSEVVTAALRDYAVGAGSAQVPPTMVSISNGGKSASFAFTSGEGAPVGGSPLSAPVAEGAPPLPDRLTISGMDLFVFIEERKKKRTPPANPFGEVFSQKVFVVGAGGIGCELLKNLVLSGFRNLEIIDLDDVDATNLNRQFLFRTHHVGKSKAEVAKETADSWFANLPEAERPRIVAHHGNVMSNTFDIDFFRECALVVNGLDNMKARKHVNRMCMQAGVPLVESGTMGYNGQVQPIIKGKTQCYDCHPKPADQKTFAVCTIHARPTSMVHCVHYAKEIYGRLFGDVVSTDASAAGEGAADGKEEQKSEVAFLDNPALRSDALLLLRTLFSDRVKELLELKGSEWTIRPPVPINVPQFVNPATVPSDTEVATVEDVCRAFVDAASRCEKRGRAAFTKDDALSVDFVAATANLRAAVFHIPMQSRSDVRTIAGSIVPAIASTNAVIAAGVVAQAREILHGKAPQLTYLRKTAQTRRRRIRDPSTGAVVATSTDFAVMQSLPPESPSAECLVCSDRQRQLKVTLNAELHTVGSLMAKLVVRELSFVAPTLNVGASTVYEHEDFESLASRPITQWIPTDGSACIATLGDLYQEQEWSVELRHDSEACTDIDMFVIEGQRSIELEDDKKKAPAVATSTVENGSTDAAVVADVDDDAVVIYHPAGKGSAVNGPATRDDDDAIEIID